MTPYINIIWCHIATFLTTNHADQQSRLGRIKYLWALHFIVESRHSREKGHITCFKNRGRREYFEVQIRVNRRRCKHTVKYFCISCKPARQVVCPLTYSYVWTLDYVKIWSGMILLILMSSRFILPNLINVRSLIRIRCELVKMWVSKVAILYKEMYARGHMIDRSIGVVLCLYEKYEEFLKLYDIG